MKFNAKEDLKRLFVVCLASVIMALNIKSFVRTGGLYPGGATGLTLLIQRSAELFFHITLPYTVVNVILNAIPVYIGLRFIGKKFTMYSCLMIFLSSALTDILPGYVITYDTLLIGIFGGLINGLVISLCLAGNATTGGTDFIAIFLSDRKGIDSWNVILGLNVVILAIAGVLFGWDKALYSIIFQYTSTQVLHILYKRYQKQTLIIVTKRPEDVYEAIAEITHHDATLIKGEGCYSKQECDVLYSVVGRDEVNKVVNTVRKTDPQAFVNMIRTENLAGRFYQRPND